MSGDAPEPRNVFERHRVLALFFVVAVPLVAIDLAAGALWNERSIRRPHGAYHHGFEPLARGSDTFGAKRTPYFTNSLAMRDASAREVPLRGDRRRVLVLGDSFAEGVGYPWDRTAVGVADAALPDRELLNAAVVSFSPLLARLRLRHLADEVGLVFDEVVLFVDISDAQDEFLYRGFTPRAIPAETLRDWRRRKLLREWSFVAGWWARRATTDGQAAWFDDGIFPELRDNYRASRRKDFWKLRGQWPSTEPPRPKWVERGLALQAEQLEKIVWLCAERGWPLTLVAYPWPPQLGRNGQSGVHIDPLRELARRYDGVELLDLYPVFDELGSPREVTDDYFIAGDMHWNEAGNALVGKALAAALRAAR